MLAVRGLAVDDEALLPVLQGSFDDPRTASPSRNRLW